MIRRAYHRIRKADGQVIEGPLVVELTDDGTFVSYHLLRQEEPYTEWLGGTYQEQIQK